jgi:exopolysaccharide biosynthesis polyprenyl glycosylphosphotransferase
MPDGSMRATLNRVERPEGEARPPIRLQDIRIRQEVLQRRQTVSLARRAARLIGLHGIDILLLFGVAALLTGESYGYPAARAYIPAIAGIFLLSLNAVSAYSPGDARRDRMRLLSGTLLGLSILTCLAVFPPNLPLSASFLGWLGLLSVLALSLGRKLVDQLVRQFYLHGIGLRRALLIGTLDEVGAAIQQLRDDQNIDQYLVGHLTNGTETDPTALGALNELARVVDEVDVQEVIVATALPPSTMREVAELCFERGIILFVFPSVLGTIDCKAEPVRVGRCSMMHLFPPRLQVPSLLLKRAFDVIVAALALLLLAPLVAVIAVAIRLDSPGPIFFRQERVGLGGRRFRIWKFRSMCADAETVRPKLAQMNAYGDPRLFKMRNDPRVTSVGRVLRRTSLDELPQLFNVLCGDMSLVGPRPPLPSEVEGYEPHHFVRLAVVPGITGPWQVNGRNLITDFEEVVRMERAYIHSWSLLLDLKILARTVPVVISGEGAY